MELLSRLLGGAERVKIMRYFLHHEDVIILASRYLLKNILREIVRLISMNSSDILNLMSENLDKFITWLQSDLPNFVAILEEGSFVTGDPTQPGFSDHDITVILNKYDSKDIQAIYDWLEKNPFDDTYLFSTRVVDGFLLGDSLNDLSMKFRSKVIIGRDVVLEKSLPDREIARRIGEDGLKGLVVRCERRWLNLSHWSLEYSQKKNYEIFKNFFVFFAAKQYGETGLYPQTRVDVAENITQKELALTILHVVNNIGGSTKLQQKIAFESAIEIIENNN